MTFGEPQAHGNSLTAALRLRIFPNRDRKGVGAFDFFTASYGSRFGYAHPKNWQAKAPAPPYFGFWLAWYMASRRSCEVPS
jgi:hypothetical protein